LDKVSGTPPDSKATGAIRPEAERLRCWAHKTSNALDKVLDEARLVLKPYREAIRGALDYAADQRDAQWVPAEFADSYSSAMRSLAEDLPASLAHLRLPSWRGLRPKGSGASGWEGTVAPVPKSRR
jgi:transposase-like protein